MFEEIRNAFLKLKIDTQKDDHSASDVYIAKIGMSYKSSNLKTVFFCIIIYKYIYILGEHFVSCQKKR